MNLQLYSTRADSLIEVSAQMRKAWGDKPVKVPTFEACLSLWWSRHGQDMSANYYYTRLATIHKGNTSFEIC